MATGSENTFELIRRKMLDDDGDTIVLTHKQAEIMERLNFAIEMRTCLNMPTKKIIVEMMAKFGIERMCAYNDLSNAEAIFGYSVNLNKRFRIGARIDYLEEQIAKCIEKEEYKAAAMMEAVLQRYYQDYPEVKKTDIPRQLNFYYEPKQGDQPLLENMPSIEEADVILSQ